MLVAGVGRAGLAWGRRRCFAGGWDVIDVATPVFDFDCWDDSASTVGRVTAVTDRTLLVGGYRNEVWMVRDGRRLLIEKRYVEDPGEPNPMYPNLPDHEAAALALLGPHGWSPRLVAHVPGVVTYEYVPGRMWRRGTAEVAVLLGAVHALSAPRELRLLCGSAAEARTHADAMVQAVPSRVVAPLAGVRPAEVSAQVLRRRSLVHTDCGPGNLVRSRRGLVLIDWQCPGRGDPVEDVACFVSPAMMILYQMAPHSPAARHAFLAAYPDRAIVARYRRDSAAWHYRIAAYCVWRADRLARRLPEVADRYRRASAAEIAFIEALS